MGNHNSLRLGRGWVAGLRGGMLASLALLVSCTPNLGEKPGGLIPLAMSMFEEADRVDGNAGIPGGPSEEFPSRKVDRFADRDQLAPAPASAGSASTPDDRRTNSGTPARPGATHTMRGSVESAWPHKPRRVGATPIPAFSESIVEPTPEPTEEPTPVPTAVPTEEPTAAPEPTIGARPVPTPIAEQKVEEEDMTGFSLAIVAIVLSIAALIDAFITSKQVGPRGPEGPRGVPGLIGPMGPPGISGESITGPAGPPGATGHAGRPGESVTGPRGRTGKTGAQGEDGDEGETIVGPRGPRGR